MPHRWTEKDLTAIAHRLRSSPAPLRPRKRSFLFRKKYAHESKLQLACVLAGLPRPALEFKFLQDRKFRFDLAWREQRLACEIDGMAHRIKARFLADMEKMNLAREAGWSVVHVTPKMIGSGQAIELIRRALSLHRGA